MVKRVHALASLKRLDADALAHEVGIDPVALGDPDGRVDVDRSDAFIEALDREAGEPMLGVELAFTRDPETYDAAGVVMLASPTLRVGFDRAFRIQSLWGDGERFRRDGDALAFSPALRGAAHRRAHEVVTECALVEIALAARFLAQEARPLGIELAYDASDRQEALAIATGTPVRGGAKRSSIRLPAAVLDAPMPPNALEVIGLCALPGGAPVRDQVRRMAGRATILGDATLVTIAGHLGLPPRTLQRRLAEEGATFAGIIEEERRRLAHAWLKGGLSIAETGALLGYADKAAFYRAFRKWTGTTPHEARGRMAAHALPSSGT
jgi:AraC-like DNA-binding protein